jgi:uncharacterized protein (TIGR03437 family)
MWVSIFGSGFTSGTVTAVSVPLPSVLDGVTVELDDGTQTRQAPLLFVSPRQINAMLPYDVPPTLDVRVRNAAGVSESDKITLIDRAPRLFTRPTGEPLVFHMDFTPVSEAAPAEPGETLVAYATGLGALDVPVAAGDAPGEVLRKVNISIGVNIGGRPADVLYAGLAPGIVGLYQINFTVPPALDDGTFEVAVSAGSERSQADMRVPVRRKPTGPREYYVSPDGTPEGDGTRLRPWDLKTALRPAAAIKPGDKLWLRGGVYGDGKTTFESRLAGVAGKPVIVRQAAGERATINGGLAIYAPYTWYWGFEVTQRAPVRQHVRGQQRRQTHQPRPSRLQPGHWFLGRRRGRRGLRQPRLLQRLPGRRPRPRPRHLYPEPRRHQDHRRQHRLLPVRPRHSGLRLQQCLRAGL